MSIATPFRLARPGALALSSVLGAVLIAGTVAGPALADAPPITPPATPSAAATAFDTVTSIGGATPASAGTSSLGARPFAVAAATVGKRQTFTRGGVLAWSSDTFQWFWSGSSMTSSTASQACGFVAPNVVTLKGVKRTLATSSEHLWQGTAAVGAEVPTPWSPVVIYSSTITDYFTLTPNKLTHSNS